MTPDRWDVDAAAILGRAPLADIRLDRTAAWTGAAGGRPATGVSERFLDKR